MLHQYQITDPMGAQSRGEFSAEAYARGVAEGAFTYVVLDRGMGEEARRMDAAVRPLLSLYELRMSAIEPTLGQTIEIYARKGEPPATESIPGIHIVSPASNSVVRTNDGNVAVAGRATEAQKGWSVRLEVFTNRWYAEPDSTPIASDGSFIRRFAWAVKDASNAPIWYVHVCMTRQVMRER